MIMPYFIVAILPIFNALVVNYGTVLQCVKLKWQNDNDEDPDQTS